MFRAGAVRYTVRVTERPIVWDGSRCFGLCSEGSREILLSPTLPIDRRLWTLLHELAHAHVQQTGMPADEEGLCDMFATVAELAMRDLDSSGGEEALTRLSPGEELGMATGKIVLTRNRYCPLCQGTIAPGSIQCTRDPATRAVVKLRAHCDHCGVWGCWSEQATHGGLPSGVVIGNPTIERGGHNLTPLS